MAQRILVPFNLVDPTPVSPALAENLTTMEVVALGHYPVPEQASNESASEQFADEARRKLDLLARPFVREGGTVRPHIVFGKDQSEAVARVMEDEECIAKLEPAANATVNRILIPIPGVRTFSRLSEFVSLLAGNWPQELTLFHVVENEESRREGDRIVSETKTQLLDAGVSAERVHTRVTEVAHMMMNYCVWPGV
jgi:hypothetical protein